MSDKELDEAVQARPGSHIRYGVETIRTVKGRPVIMTKNARVKSVDDSGKVLTHNGIELDPAKKVASRSNIEKHHDWHIIKEGRDMHFLRNRDNLTEKVHIVHATYSGGDAGRGKRGKFRTEAPTEAAAKNKVGVALSRRKYNVHDLKVVHEEVATVDEGKTYRVDPEDVKGSKRSKSALKRRDNDDRARGSSKRSVEEEVEQLDEIGDTAMGKITLKNYIKKAATAAADHRTISLNHYRNASLDKDPDEIRKQNDLGNKRGRKAHDRLRGIGQAADRLSRAALKAHEEVEQFDEGHEVLGTFKSSPSSKIIVVSGKDKVTKKPTRHVEIHSSAGKQRLISSVHPNWDNEKIKNHLNDVHKSKIHHAGGVNWNVKEETVTVDEGKTYRSDGGYKSKDFRNKMRKFSSGKRKASIAKREVSED